MKRVSSSTMLKTVLITLGILLLVRMSLPYAAQWYINDTLDKGKEFTGSVGDVDIMLWRGAYSLENVEIFKRNGEVEQPFFNVKEVDISVLWSALFNGAVVGEVALTKPEINFVDGASDASSQSGKDENWLYLADQIVPLKVDRFTITDGTIRFINPEASPRINLELHDIKATAINLVNSRDLAKDLVAKLTATGQTQEQGTVTLKSSLNPATPKPTFDVDLQANDVALVNFRHFLDTYAPFDLEAGTLELAVELASDNGRISGYAKPILHHVEVFSWKGDIERDDDGFFRGIAEALSGFIAELFENQSEDQIATRVPISGTIDDVDTPILTTIGGILRNAFIKAIRGNIEGSVDWADTQDEDKQPDGEKPQQDTKQDEPDS